MARAPEAAIRGGKGTPVYLAHSYPTKVPPEAIEPLIEHFTRPGDVVVDSFAGSGMTGVAAMRLGRHAYLNDLSPLAGHISRNVTTPCDADELRMAAGAILAASRDVLESSYRGRCTACGSWAELEWLLWGETVACPDCAAPVRLWDAGFDRARGIMPRLVRCNACKAEFSKQSASLIESAPVWARVSCRSCQRSSERSPLHSDVAVALESDLMPIKDWYPRVPVRNDREMYLRSALHIRGINEVADFYTRRNLRVLARLWNEILTWPNLRARQALAFAFTNTAWHGTRMRRFNARGGQRPLTGTLYIPQMSVEVNVARVFAHKIAQLGRFYEDWPTDPGRVHVHTGSATNLGQVPDGSADYVFTDPPFGSNIFYADCNLIGEAWLGQLTPTAKEAVVNRSLSVAAGGKTVNDYHGLMAEAFAEITRILKPRAWATVVFQNTDPTVWAALQDAAQSAGLTLEQAAMLDKTQHSHKGYKGRSGAENVAAFDMVLNLRRDGISRPLRSALVREERIAQAADFLRRHLAHLPPIGSSVEADRQRTLPFMYSLLLGAHFNGDIGLEAEGFSAVRTISSANFESDGRGHWYLDERRSRPDPAKHGAKKPISV